MSIIISQDGKNAKKIDKSDFKKEGYLQTYIHENPESIPIYEIEEDKKLLVVAREFRTGSNKIDALAIDKDGDIYVVETKLYKNADKRTVVAQALDYGASLWRHSDYNEFISRITNEINRKFSVSFEEKAKDFFKIDDEEIVAIQDEIKNNFQQGKIKFVILMDTIDERLKDLIVYINQNSQFDIYAVQMEYYRFEKYEIMIPRLFGAEVKKNFGGGSSGDIWTPERFLGAAKKRNDDNTYNILSELLDFIIKNPDHDFGKGKESGRILFRIKAEHSKSILVTIFVLWTNGKIRFRFNEIKLNIGEESLKLYFNKLKDVLPPQIWTEEILKQDTPSFAVNELFTNEKMMKRFEAATIEYVKEIKR